ncbi:MAG: VWA domain-containing protein [Bryobacteraceae bacterium]
MKFLETVKPDDRIAVYVLGSKLRVIHDFKGDFESLRTALGRSRGENTARLEASQLTAADTINPELDDFLNGANQAIADFKTIDRVESTTAAFETIARHVGSVPGRKNLIWISGSFPFTLGLESPIGGSNERRTFNDQIQRMARRLNEANVAVYPVDARGLSIPAELTASAPPRNLTAPVAPPRINYRPPGLDTMQEMASRTGGIAFFNTNDLQGSIRKAMDDANVTYTLGFYPGEDELDGRYHDLKVKVARPGLELRHRKGYMANQEEHRTDKQLLDEMKTAAVSPLDLTEIGITTRTDILNQPKPATLSVTVLVDAQDLQIEKKDGKWSGKGHILIIQVGPEQKVLSSIEESYNLNLTDENYRKLLAKGLIITKRIEPDKDLQQLRILFLDRVSGRIGSLRMPRPAS